MLFSINIARDWIDNIWGWGGFIGAIIVPVLIWYFGSTRAEAKRTNHQQNEHLNYLLMVIDRYFQYLKTLDSVITSSLEKMEIFIANPNEETKMDAFHQIIPPQLNFNLKINDYAFTINNQANLIKLLMKFLSLHNELQTHIHFYNNDAMQIYNPQIPIEAFVKTAKGYRDLNFRNFLATIWLAQYILHRLFETVYGYEKHLKKSHMVSSYIPPESVNYFENIIIKLNNVYENDTWQKAYDNAIEPIKNSFYEKIYESFKNKFFNKTPSENQNTQIPFPISWMVDFVNNFPKDSDKDGD